MASVKVPPHARAAAAERGHRFAAYPRCWADVNKARERGIIEACLASLASPAAMVDGNRERPDALVKVSDELVGIEVTTVVEAQPRQQTAPQQWRAEAVRLVGKAQLLADVAGRAPVVAWLTFRPEWRPGAAPASVLAQELVDAVYRAVDMARLPHERVTVRDPHPALASVYAARALDGSYWQATILCDVVPASEADIRLTVQRKEIELPAYKLAAPRVWLLIDCDLTGQGISLDVPSPFCIQTGFERVFCCGFDMRWVELTVNL